MLGRLRSHDRDSLRAAWWGVRAIVAGRLALRRDPEGAGVALPAVPPLPARARRGLDAVLRRSRATCLVKASVRQAWLAAHGDARDLVIGVTAPAAGFRAHAWLAGDAEERSGEFTELARRPAPRVSTP
jgi:hypothetical protein